MPNPKPFIERKRPMPEAETLHKRKMQLKNDIVKPLVALIDKGVDVKSNLQNLISNYQDMSVDQKQKQGHCRPCSNSMNEF
jgi:hypothetical protein